jgi:hypothetical protein
MSFLVLVLPLSKFHPSQHFAYKISTIIQSPIKEFPEQPVSQQFSLKMRHHSQNLSQDKILDWNEETM